MAKQTISEIFWGAQGIGFILAGVGLIVAANQRASRFGISTFILGALGLVFEGLDSLIFYTNTSLYSSAWQRASWGLQGAGYLLVSVAFLVALNSKRN